MGTSIAVNESTFATEVLEQSFEKPVLVDFYATWCGPCQMLKPLLEKLVQEYDFVLAKVDIDQNPQLANEYAVEGVPDVRVVVQGKVYPGFVGVLPEPKLRSLMEQLNLSSALDTGLEAIQVATTAGDLKEVDRLYTDLLQTYPTNRQLVLSAARFMVSRDRPDEAETWLDSFKDYDKDFFEQSQSIKLLIQFKREAQNPVIQNELDELYFKGVHCATREDYEAALQAFLELVARDRKYRNDAGRKSMLALFNLLGDDHPLTATYRKKLMQTLY